MKKVVSALCVLIILLLASTALAADVQVTTEPAQITSAGSITARFSVVNDSSYEMRNINISGYGLSGSSQLSSQVVPPNGKLGFAFPIEVTEEMLGQTITYTLSWTENNAPKSKDVPITLGAPPAAEMTATRTASKASGKSGEKVTLTYTLNNPGTAEMTGVTIKDPAAGNSPVASNLTLAPGTSKTVTYELTLGAQDAVSTPSITYQINGEGKALSIDPLTVAVRNIKLDFTVTKGEPTPEGVAFVLALSNSGNQPISNVNVTDDLGNTVPGSGFKLGAGETKTLEEYLVSTNELRNVSFTVTGTDEQGQPIPEDKKGPYEVWPYNQSNISLSLAATVVTPLSDSGRMKVKFTIQNNSDVDMTSAIISEKELGNIEGLDILPRGETVVEKELLVGASRELKFVLTASDPSGAPHSFEANLLAAPAMTALPNPSPSPALEEEPASAGGMSGTLVTVLIVLAALMAVAGIALLALSIYERKRNATLEEEEPDELPRARNAAQARVNDAEREAQSQPYPLEQNVGRASRFAQPQREQEEFASQTRPVPVERERPVYQPAPSHAQPQERASVYTQERAAQTQERASVPPLERAPFQPRVPQQPVRHVEPEPEQRPPQASPEIRNRVHRVRNTDQK